MSDSQPRFRLDVDRFTDQPGEIPATAGRLDAFATDIFSVFREAAGETLIEWMSGGEDAA